MYSIDSGKKEVILTIKNGNVIQNIRVPYEGASYYVKEFLTSYYEMYDRHRHTSKVKERIDGSGIKPPIDWRGLANLTMEYLVFSAFNAVQYGKADEVVISHLMDTAVYMFEEIHSFYRANQD